MTDHLSDAQLFRLIDGPDEHRDAEDHVSVCQDCRSRLSVLQVRTERFSALLRETDDTVPTLVLHTPARVSRPVLVAATLTMLFGVSLFVQPVRAWILEQGRTVWERVNPGATANSETAMSTIASDHASTSGVSFRPRGPTLSIHVSVWQSDGAIAIRRGVGQEVTASVIDAGETDGIAVLPRGLRIENAPGSNATYVITIPGGVTDVVVTVAGENVTRFIAGDGFTEQSVNLVSRHD